jgi:hypothetical protein
MTFQPSNPTLTALWVGSGRLLLSVKVQLPLLPRRTSSRCRRGFASLPVDAIHRTTQGVLHTGEGSLTFAREGALVACLVSCFVVPPPYRRLLPEPP